MKRINNLFCQLQSKERIIEIIRMAAKGKKKRPEVIDALNHINERAEDIMKMICTGNYWQNPVHYREITERGKKRQLTISPFFPNRILDYMITETIKPYIKRSMYELCVGNVNGRGTTVARKSIDKNCRKYKWHIKLDIHHFYPSVTSETMISFIHTKVKDKDFLKLCDFVVGSNRYLPIGSFYSQWFSNWILQDIDHAIKEKLKVPFYVRYVDDMLLMGNNKRELRRAMFEIEKMLNDKGLSLKKHEHVKSMLTQPIDFLGFRFCADKTHLRRKVFQTITQRMRNIRKSKHVCVSQSRSVIAFCGWLKQTTHGYGFYVRHIKPLISIGTARKMISDFDKKRKASIV